MVAVKPLPAPKAPAEAESGSQVMSTAAPTRLHRRHVIIAASFLVAVIIPTIVSAFYLFAIAEDQYSSEMSFSIQSEEFTNPLEALQGLGQVSTGTSSDSEVLYEFIESQKIVRDIDEKLNLRAIFSRAEDDPVYTIHDDATIEELREHWRWRVQATHESGSGLLRVKALAFTPEDAQNINESILAESQALVDRLSKIAREDAIRYAEVDLEEANERLKKARRAFSEFRAANNIVDPTLDVQSRSGVETALEQQLAEAMISRDLLERSTQDPNDPRLSQAQNRIDSIRKRIEDERTSLGQGQAEGLIGVIGQFEELTVDREFAEKAYLSAAAAFDTARAEAKRRTKYLAVHVEPTIADSSLYPKRALTLGIIFGFSFLLWALVVMVGYSLRDRG